MKRILLLLTEREYEILHDMLPERDDFMDKERAALSGKLEDQLKKQQPPRANLHFLYGSLQEFFTMP